MYEKWTCSKCGHVNDPNAVRVSGMSFGRESFSDFVSRAHAAGTEEQERRSKFCGSCGTAKGAAACIIATACLGESSSRLAMLRRIRDDAICADPIARDFFHVFWSRYYQWSPGVARIASEDAAVAEHIRWAFLEPWMAWLELVALIGRRGLEEIGARERDEILGRLNDRISGWLSQLPALMDGKCPSDSEAIHAAFEQVRSRMLAAMNSAEPL